MSEVLGFKIQFFSVYEILGFWYQFLVDCRIDCRIKFCFYLFIYFDLFLFLLEVGGYNE